MGDTSDREIPPRSFIAVYIHARARILSRTVGSERERERRKKRRGSKGEERGMPLESITNGYSGSISRESAERTRTPARDVDRENRYIHKFGDTCAPESA